jgi:tetratricopeptide (TPR) repeat protein
MAKALSYVLVVLFVLVLFLPANAEDVGDAYYDLGVFAYEDGDYESAERHLKKALEFELNNPFYNHFLGKIYLTTERYQEAMNYLNAAWEVDPDVSELKYDMAFLHFKMSNYPMAPDLFAEIVDEDPSNVLAHYHDLYQTALDYFLAAAEKSPANKANGYYYGGVCYWKTGRTEKAVALLEWVKACAEPPELRENASELLHTITKGKIKKEKEEKIAKPYSLYLKTGFYYDDNVPLEPLDKDVVSDEDDFVTKAYFSGKYNFVNKKEYNLGAGYRHYQAWHYDVNEYDQTGSVLDLYAKYRLKPLTLGFSFLPSYYWLDVKSYLRRYGVKPEVVWKCNENLSTGVSYSYYDNEYFQNEDRTGHTNDIFLNAYYSILNKKGYIFGGIGYEDNSASHPDQDYNRIRTRLGVSLLIPWELKLTLTGKYYDKEYDNVDTFYGVKRDDSQYQGSVSISHRFLYDWLNISAELNYTENDSNIDDFEYERTVTGVSLIARY